MLCTGRFGLSCRHVAGKYRKYRFDSLRDLLRVIRNKHNHYRCVLQPLLTTPHAVSLAPVCGVGGAGQGRGDGEAAKPATPQGVVGEGAWLCC